MMNVAALPLRELLARLCAQSLEMAALRSAVDLQFARIACRQAELDRFADVALKGQTRRRTVGRSADA
jgi:hypothetical protein